MNALTKNIIRIWIALTSLFAFAVGWITLSHSEKPVALVQTTDTSNVNGVELTPIPSLEQLTQNSQNSSNVPSFSITNMFTPRLRTKGS